MHSHTQAKVRDRATVGSTRRTDRNLAQSTLFGYLEDDVLLYVSRTA